MLLKMTLVCAAAKPAKSSAIGKAIDTLATTLSNAVLVIRKAVFLLCGP